ncbi:methyltransferase family protein [Lutibacter sp. Hel_I_33_5]|uniref:class I SAM-dependent methyltransferase n=1 Tax=Lutibacter sp. Hel_I_33_5 TaxID=1566289 RepID=UPI0011A5E949|nr:class I SAM-dependent methyltransferase [Lutibacter sp. Hel_I_33_5]TVZ57033.1 methyltransferase family protein [Lutibacter sp. Hel_I_33_5]
MKLFYFIKYKLRLAIIKPLRYRTLISEIAKQKSNSILEVGVFNGRNSNRMIETAKSFHKASTINYYGFDLFEMLTEDELKEEFSKRPLSKNSIQNKLNPTGANINLYQGYSQKTLPKFVSDNPNINIDFIFIDGGHSIDTVKSDWENLTKIITKDTVIIFDDYYENTEKEILGKGCNELIDALDRNKYQVELLNPINSFQHDWGVLNVRFAKVQLK